MHENIVRIKVVNEVLKGLDQEFVFVGGATVSLYATNPELASETRPTDDVDVVIELATYGGYAGIDEKLRGLGFKNDVASGVICRYQWRLKTQLFQPVTTYYLPHAPYNFCLHKRPAFVRLARH